VFARLARDRSPAPAGIFDTSKADSRQAQFHQAKGGKLTLIEGTVSFGETTV
jgi:hypothetical protein